MFILISDIPPEGLEFSDKDSIQGEISFAGRDITPLTSIALKSLAFRVEQTGEDVMVMGEAVISFSFCCDRCGKDVERESVFPFTEVLENNMLAPQSGEKELAREELEISFFEGEGFLVEDILLEQVFLSLPQKKLCDGGCLGLCIVCGHDLNLGECGCERAVVDPRWIDLKKLIDEKE